MQQPKTLTATEIEQRIKEFAETPEAKAAAAEFVRLVYDPIMIPMLDAMEAKLKEMGLMK